MSGEKGDHYQQRLLREHQLMFHDDLSSFFLQKTSGAATSSAAAVDTSSLGFNPQGTSPPFSSTFSDGHFHGAFDFSPYSPPPAADRFGVGGASAAMTVDASEFAGKINTPAGSSSSSEIAGGEEVDARLSKNEQVKHEGSEERTSTDHKSKKLNKPRKKGEKRQREHRFAFMTRSEVDNLEDGYRWRKYGQKAVKNSPYPRSYYRCTAQQCSVKKRVERSYQDPTVVMTTYEGQHTHPSPAAVRASAHLLPPPAAPPFLTSNFHQNLFMQQVMTSPLSNNNINSTSTNPNMFLQPISVPTSDLHEQHQIQFSDYYSLQDSMLPPFVNNGSTQP